MDAHQQEIIKYKRIIAIKNSEIEELQKQNESLKAEIKKSTKTTTAKKGEK